MSGVSTKGSTGGLRPYERVVRALERDILSEKYRPGEALPGLKEVAAGLGVHFLTVRKAVQELSRRGVVRTRQGARAVVTRRPAAREKRVLKIAAVYSERLIGIDRHHPLLGAFVNGVSRRCHPEEVLMQIKPYRDGHFIDQAGPALLESGVEGVIHFGFTNPEDHAAYLEQRGIVLVEADLGGQPRQGVLTVHYDWAGAMGMLVRHLQTLGHRRLVCIDYGTKRDGGKTQQEFLRLMERGGEGRRRLILVDNPPGHVAWEQMDRIFDLDPLPTGVVVRDEFMADRLMEQCARRGIAVPDRMSVAALSDLWPGRHRSAVTTGYTFAAACDAAFRAADLLIRRLHGERVDVEQVIGPVLKVEGSTGPAPRVASGARE